MFEAKSRTLASNWSWIEWLKTETVYKDAAYATAPFMWIKTFPFTGDRVKEERNSAA